MSSESTIARTALIVGAGIGGLAAGIALRRAGWSVRIFERAANPRDLGFALNLAPNAIEALRELGLAERVVAQGCVITGTEVRRAGGKVVKRFNMTSALSHTPSVVALRQAVHGTLLDAIEPAALALGRDVVGFTATTTGVMLMFKHGGSESGDVLVGADGAGSVIRTLLHPAEPPLRRSGYFAIRGIAYGVPDYLGHTTAVAYLGRAVEAAVVRAGKDVVYWYMSLLSEDVSGSTEAPRAIAERCAARLDQGFQAVVRATNPDDLRLDELLDRDPITGWGTGPVTLLGDAAHPMLPHTGQGAAQALEDAIALGLALASGGAPTLSLRRYEQVRSRRTRRLVHRGRRIATITTTKNPFVRAMRDAAIRVLPAKAMAASFLLAGRTDPHRALRSPTGL